MSVWSETDPAHPLAEQAPVALAFSQSGPWPCASSRLKVAQRRHVISHTMKLRFQASGKRNRIQLFELEAVAFVQAGRGIVMFWSGFALTGRACATAVRIAASAASPRTTGQR